MTLATADLGVLGDLAVALGVFRPGGDPNPDWFANPEASLKNILGNSDQRNALVAFVDQAMGGADRTTDPRGVVWLPIVHLEEPDLTLAVTLDDAPADAVHVGVGILVRTSNPRSVTSLAIPLFRVQKQDGSSVSTPILLGSAGGRMRIATSVTIDDAPPLPGTARLGALGLDFDVPTTTADPQAPLFGLLLSGFQLPGAQTPRDIRIAADGLGELDDALLDFVLSLVRTQADAAAPESLIATVAGLLGLKAGDSVPDFPIAALAAQGPHAISAWVHDVLTAAGSRDDWLGYIASLLGGTRAGDAISFDLGGAADLTFALAIDSGPSGNTRVTPTLGIQLGNTAARVEARAALFQIDLVTGAAIALPTFGVWAAAGGAGPGNRILDVATPTVARADTLRVGFALDSARRLNFVLAADVVTLGAHDYPTLDLTSPDAVMDAVGNTVADVASQLLASLGAALPTARLLLGLDAPAGVTAVSVSALMSNPVGTVGGYWRDLLGAPAATTTVLAALRDALADATEAASAIQGTGTSVDPWRVKLIGPLQLELSIAGTVASIGIAAATRVDTLGQRCTVVETRFAATIATIDLAANIASLLPGVEAVLTGRERGINPPRVRLPLGDDVVLTASGVGLRLAWSPAGGFGASVVAPNLELGAGSVTVPIALPVVAADGSVVLPPAAWDGVEALVGYLGALAGGFLGDIVDALGWSVDAPAGLGGTGVEARLSLADLVADPRAALADWLPRIALSESGPRALAVLADLFGGVGPNRGFLEGTGHPDDPYRFPLADGLPNIAVWFPPAGLEPRLVNAPDALRNWRPGDPGLSGAALAAGLVAEARVDGDIRTLIDGRDLAGGIEALIARWTGGDGRIVPPTTPPAGVVLDRAGVAAGQLLSQLDFEDVIGRVPTTTVYVALGSRAWLDVPAERRVDLTAPALAAAMFAQPVAATGEWFVALGSRADSRLAGSTTDGTPEQAARVQRVLDALATVSADIAVVAVAGAGHAARLAAQAQSAVTDLITLGTPLGSISLTAISTQPTADALRLLHRLLPPPPLVDATAPDLAPEDDDLALGRALIAAMMELVDRADPSAELRAPVVPPDPPRAGLTVSAVFGTVNEGQVRRAVTAIVAAGLALRATVRASTPLPDPTGVAAGLRLVVPDTTSGALSVTGDALVTLLSYELATDTIDISRRLRVRVRLGDRLGWLSATPDLELRMVTADVRLPLDAAAAGAASITLHDARVFGRSWERLVLGTGAAEAPVLPEARVLLAAAIQRLTADTAGTASVALRELLIALGIIAPGGGLAADAVDQLVHDPGGLVRERLAIARADLASALAALLGPLATAVDLGTGSLRINAGDDTSGRFGWHADVTASAAGISGQLRFGPATFSGPAGALNVIADLKPFQVMLQWHQPGGTTDAILLWPTPDAGAIARALAKAAPSLGGHAALELLRRADETARPVVDAVLDGLGLLSGAATDPERSLRPLAGLLADPAGWLRNAESLAASPAKIQALFDALRPLLGIGGAAGTPVAFADGVTLTVAAAGAGATITLEIDATKWTAPAGATARFAAGLGASLTVGPLGPPVPALEVYVGMAGAASGRRAVHARLAGTGAELFVRPDSGADIPLLPFAGLGSLAAAAEAALPFLLDQLAALPGTTGTLVQTVGDALALRSGGPKHFDAALLRAWAADPAGALSAAVPSIVATGLPVIAPLLDAFVPAAINVAANANTLTITVGDLTLAWTPAGGVIALSGTDVAVPGLDGASFTLAANATGLQEASATFGPMNIAAGGATLRPFVTVAAGTSPAGGRRVAVGLAIDDTHRFAARWLLDTNTFAFVASDGAVATAVDTTDATQVALRAVEVTADLVAAVALAQQAVTDVLDKSIGETTARNVLRGVVLQDVNNPTALIGGLFDPATLLARIHKLFGNLAGAGIAITVDAFTVSLLKVANVIGLQVGLTGRLELARGNVALWLENDAKWIANAPAGAGGLFVGFLPDTLPLAFTPSVSVMGVGLRVGKSSGPLIDIGITIESVALHAYAEIDASGAHAGGVQLQFSNLAAPVSGAKGDNGIAQGVMRDSGPTPPKPAFSPALAIQKRGNDPVAVTLRAGDGDGPWWIAIRKGFGPLYLEQIGFGATMPHGRVERISVLMDGSVSMFGLTCAVDDLQITYLAANGDVFNVNNWAVDLAGLAVSANMAGVTIAGGLLKQTSDVGIEYLGMLLGRFAVYGITIYGGYGEGQQNGEKFTAFFAVGAVNGPIGGPPAFFLTGIGGGFGINRRLVVPEDLSRFGDYPLIQALDIAAKPVNPMDQLRALGGYFPMERGTFWFAAGLSFNSFALVDGIAVVAVEIGNGLDINLLGLARMALPRPQVALVSIELALLVRFSSSEGVIWVQGQLTDNSWLLYPDVKLTGGFAYVIWFKGEHAGEFVLTLGGYHPDFHRDGYPQVPRLGLRWSIGDAIVIKSGSYFALTSEALMAGGDFQASAHFGPAWAEVKFGADGIVYFDPFRYQVSVYARIAAGVTIDTWLFGEITISVHLGARIDVTGPDFHGKATFEVGPVGITVEFGGSDRSQVQPLSATAFITKYLSPTPDGAAEAHAVMTSFGAQPAKGKDATPDGSSARPYVVVVEFGLTFTTTVPAISVTRTLAAANATTNHSPSRKLGVAPMNDSDVQSLVTLTWQRAGTSLTFPFEVTPRPFGSFPVGVWGPPQDPNNRKVPKAEMIEALCELDLATRAVESAGGPEIPYFQVEIGRRKPLPFTRRNVDVTALKTQANSVAALVDEPASTSAAFADARAFLALTATPTALASLRGERQAPPLLGTLAERLDADALTVVPAVGVRPPAKVYDHFVDPPIAVGLMSGASLDLRTTAAARTTVKDSAGAWRVSPPTLARVEAERSRSIAARLVVAEPVALGTGHQTTVLGAVDVPPTAVAHAAPAVVARTAAPATERLTGFSGGLVANVRAGGDTPGATLAPGDIAVLKLPNAHADAAIDGDRPSLAVRDGVARIVLLAHGGKLLADAVLGKTADAEHYAGSLAIPPGAERIIAIGQVARGRAPPSAGLSGWHAGVQMIYAGWATGIAPGCVVRSAGEPLRLHRERFDAGWVTGAELARGVSTVTTTFADAPITVVVVLDDPAAFGTASEGRQLLLGLDGASRAIGGDGQQRPPVLLAMENRSVLAYDVVPAGKRPVTVSIASQEGWSLVGVMASGEMNATAAVALISARGLDAALRPFAGFNDKAGGTVAQLHWRGPSRTPEDRRRAQALARGRPLQQDAPRAARRASKRRR